MNKTKILDKYDKDFVNIMIEIQNRIEDFSKVNKLKINSWAKSLCLPTNNISWKKNRNLYAIKLLDNIVNCKLEKPFTKFADEGENLPMLDPILVKSQLTNKVKEILLNSHPDVQIQNFINSNTQLIEPNLYDNYNININNVEPEQIELNLNRAKTPTRININNNKNSFNNNKKKVKPKNKNNKMIKEDFEDNIFNNEYENLERVNNFSSFNNNNGPEIEDNKRDRFFKGDQLLNKNYFNFNEKLSKEPGFYLKTNAHSYASEKAKLQSTIIFLENETKIKNQIINQQNMDIQQMKKRIADLEKKIKNLFSK